MAIARQVMQLVNMRDLMKPPFCALLIGKPKSGKSHLAKYLTYFYCAARHSLAPNELAQWVVVFTGSRFNDDYSFLPEQAIREYSKDSFIEYKERMDQMASEAKRQGKKLPQNLLIMDDLAGILNASDELFNSFVTRHRHYSTNIIVCIQYVNKNISTTVRECITHAFLFKSKKRITIKALWEAFGQDFSLEDFEQLLWARANNEEHTCMLVMEHVDEIAENYRTFKAPAQLPNRRIVFGTGGSNSSRDTSPRS